MPDFLKKLLIGLSTFFLLSCGNEVRLLRAVQSDQTDTGGASPSYLLDDFNDNSLGPNWLNDGTDPTAYGYHFHGGHSFTVTETGGQLELSEVTADWQGAGIETAADYDMTNAWFSVEMTQAPVDDGLRYREGGLWVINDSFDGWEMYKANGDLGMGTWLSNHTGDIVSIPFDPVAHRFFRIRHDQAIDEVAFETSPDGNVWTIRRSMPRTLPVTVMRGMLYVFTANSGHGPTGTPAAVFDNFSSNAVAH